MPAVPPVLVREQALYGTGYFPGEREMIYEVPATSSSWSAPPRSRSPRCTPTRSWRAASCPSATAGFSTCFRREAGAAGRDTRGIFRVHQFDKVEMFSFVEPDGVGSEHERILAIQEGILGALEIPYRVVDIAGRRPRRSGGPQVRLRGLDPESGALPRVDKLLQHDRLPGKTPVGPVPSRARRIPGTRAHAERNCGGCRADADRAAGERTDRGRDAWNFRAVLQEFGAPGRIPT